VTWYGYAGWSALGVYNTASGSGIAGAGAGFWTRAVVRVDSQASTASRIITGRFSGAPGGWQLRCDGFCDSLYFRAVNGAATFIASPTFTVTAAMVGKLIDLWGVHDGSVLRTYVNGVETGSGTAITGYTAGAAAHSIGARDNQTLQATNMTIFGVAGGVGVPSLAEIQAAYAAAKLAGDVTQVSGKTDHLWSVSQQSKTAVQNSLSDRVGADTATIFGATTGLTLQSTTNPAWA
jgi:hypothetical protein